MKVSDDMGNNRVKDSYNGISISKKEILMVHRNNT